MRRIPVGDTFATIDDCDWVIVASHRWRLHSSGRYAWRGGGNNKILMHRQIMDAQEGEFVDHVNGDGLDNRRSNLRICTHQQNLRNRRGPACGASRFRGVSIDRRKARKKWRAHITVDGRQRSLGYYVNEEDAARAYDAASRELFGEYASPNFAEYGRRVR